MLTFDEMMQKLSSLSVLGVLETHQEDGGRHFFTVHVHAAGKDHLVMYFDQGNWGINPVKCSAWFEVDVSNVRAQYPGSKYGEARVTSFEDFESAYEYLVKYLLENEDGIKRALADVFKNLKG